MGHHDFTDVERKQYEGYAEMFGHENGHVAEVLKAGKWHSSRGDGLRHCWFCGSLHPEELLQLFQSSKVSGYSGSDWKYGYPHKFYIEVESGKPAVTYYEINGERVSKEEWDKANADRNYRYNPAGGRSMGSGREPGTGTIHAKFYTMHLLDVEDAATFSLIADLFRQKFGIAFGIQDGKLTYTAPRHGHQSSGGATTS
jgi:hypothetical protein